MDITLLLVSVPSEDVAESLALLLLESKLAACVSVIPKARSFYRWKGKIEQAEELLLLIKSTQARYQELEAKIKAAHPYEVPEILCLKTLDGLEAYCDWVREETADSKESK